jgi:methylglutaconyl-CoA hydratase
VTQYTTLDLRIDARGVAYLTLNRPEKRNALSTEMIGELTDFARAMVVETGPRVVVLTGAGPAFCAGADLTWMKAQIAADRTTRIREATKLAMMLKALNEMPVPLIGRVHGAALGGGVGMAAVCDVVVAAADARFALTETRLGLIPATIGPYVLARMGEGAARRVIMSARLFAAEEAQALGLVAKVAELADLDAAVEVEVAPYLTVAPHAVAAAKALARALGPRIDAGVIEDSIRRLADTWESEEARHGIDAFLNKRAPRWGAAG